MIVHIHRYAVIAVMALTAFTVAPMATNTVLAAEPQAATATTKEDKPLSFKERIDQILKEHDEGQATTKPDTQETIDGLKVYNQKTDAAPKEDVPVVETNFTFQEPLLVRPETKAIVIHHVGIPSGEVSAQQIHAAHLANGWAGIGYHYVIHKDGTIDRGRPLATVGAHAQGRNYDTVGINVTGNFETEIPTDAQLTSLEKLIASLCRIYDITPSSTTIIGHRDVNSTDCPGRYLYAKLPQIRQDVAAMLAKDTPKATANTRK